MLSGGAMGLDSYSCGEPFPPSPDDGQPVALDRHAGCGKLPRMTSENRLRFEIADIAAVVIECAACESSVSVSMTTINLTLNPPQVPARCPRCSAAWESERRGELSPEAQFLANLALYAQRVADGQRKPTVRIRLDLRAPQPFHELS